MASASKKDQKIKVNFDKETIDQLKALAPSIGVPTDSNSSIVMGTLRKAMKLLIAASKSDNIILERGSDRYKITFKN